MAGYALDRRFYFGSADTQISRTIGRCENRLTHLGLDPACGHLWPYITASAGWRKMKRTLSGSRVDGTFRPLLRHSWFD